MAISSLKIPYIRQVRGDGNCFYRGLYFSILEHIILNTTLLKRFYSSYILTFHSPVLISAFSMLISIRGLIDINQVNDECIQAYIYILCSNNISFDIAFIQLIRYNIVRFLKDEKRNGDIIVFLESDVDTLIKTITKMGTEGEGIILKIAGSVFNVNLLIYTLDNKDPSRCDCFEVADPKAALMTVRLVLHTGHYYIGYLSDDRCARPFETLVSKLLRNCNSLEEVKCPHNEIIQYKIKDAIVKKMKFSPSMKIGKCLICDLDENTAKAIRANAIYTAIAEEHLPKIRRKNLKACPLCQKMVEMKCKCHSLVELLTSKRICKTCSTKLYRFREGYFCLSCKSLEMDININNTK